MDNLALEVPKLPKFQVSIIPSAIEERKIAIEESQQIVRVESVPERDDAIAAASMLKSVIKRMEETRVEVKRPVLEAANEIDGKARDFSNGLKVELVRVEKLLKTYQTECDAKAEQLRQEEIDSMPKPVNEDAMREQAVRILELNQPLRLDGASVRRDWEFDVIDALELAQARPDLVTIEPKMRELKAALTIANGIIPGVSARIVSKVQSKASV